MNRAFYVNEIAVIESYKIPPTRTSLVLKKSTSVVSLTIKDRVFFAVRRLRVPRSMLTCEGRDTQP